jgi:3-hydroxyisobutyrate dehydrogenase-like beta-hydroxyacid dehydrogenase
MVFTAQLALASEAFDLAASRGLDPAAISTVLGLGSGRAYAAEVVANSGYSLAAFGGVAGTLLAKDVGILAEHARLTDSTLLATADAALERMGVARTAPGGGDS